MRSPLAAAQDRWRGAVGEKVVPVSLYEALSLVVSSVGTLGTVYIGLRQLRQSAPRPAHPEPAARVPAGPYGPYAAYPPPPSAPARLPSAPPRPSSVTAAVKVLFIAAAAHPFAVVLYYVIRLVTAPSSAAAELGNEGVIDVLVFGGVAFLTALLGVFVTRRSRVALWLARVLGAGSVVLLGALALGVALNALGPEETRLRGLELLFLGYFSFVLVMYAVAAIPLFSTGARAYFRRP
jgi:hypothetical protein